MFSVPGETDTGGKPPDHNQPLLLLLQRDLPADPEDVELRQQDGGLHGVPRHRLVLAGQHHRRGELQAELHGEMSGATRVRLPGRSLRSDHQPVQHVQVSFFTSLGSLSSNSGLIWDF